MLCCLCQQLGKVADHNYYQNHPDLLYFRYAGFLENKTNMTFVCINNIFQFFLKNLWCRTVVEDMAKIFGGFYTVNDFGFASVKDIFVFHSFRKRLHHKRG